MDLQEMFHVFMFILGRGSSSVIFKRHMIAIVASLFMQPVDRTVNYMTTGILYI